MSAFKHIIGSILFVTAILGAFTATAKAGEIFECRLSSRSQAYQILMTQYRNNPTQSQYDLTVAAMSGYKRRCEKKRTDAECSLDSSCAGVLIQTQEVCRTQIVGSRDSRTMENVRVNEFGVAEVRN